jgi:anaerobic selenocysteine-containing dehydrogenase
MCHGSCRILVYVNNGKAIKVEGDPEGPINKGTLCAKGLSSLDLLYHPDRIKYPLKRVGKRGEGKWERISWEEAYRIIVAQLKSITEKYGVLSISPCVGTGRHPFFYVMRFMSASGAINRAGMPHICYTPRLGTAMVTYGRPISHDCENSKCIVAWGSGIVYSNNDGYNARQFIEGWKKGAKLICIDPVFTAMASKADLWLQVRPGTDGALALAWINVMVSENLFDQTFVKKWICGFDRLAEHIEEFTPEWAEKITWVPAEKIRQAVRMYATIKPASLIFGNAPEHGVNSTHTLRCFHFLPALTGNVDVVGGNVFLESPLPGHVKTLMAKELIPKEIWDNRLAPFPLLSLAFPAPAYAIHAAAINENPYPIKAYLVHGGGPLLSHENAKNLAYEALKKAEFIEVMDHFMTPAAELADILLPAATFLEGDDIQAALSEAEMSGYVLANRKVVEPLGESKMDSEFFIELSKRLDFPYGFDSHHQMLDWMLKPLGMTFDEFKELGWITTPQKDLKHERGLLRPDGLPGFNTPSGKIEIYSETLHSLGLSSLPFYNEPPESPINSPDLAREYPFVLTTGLRSPVYFHSQYRQIARLREIHPDPIIRINPKTAGQYGIAEGDWVVIETPRGRCRQRARLTLGIDPRVVMAEHDWWFPEMPAEDPILHGAFESNINVVTSSDPPYDPGFGSTSSRSLLCKIFKDQETGLGSEKTDY